MSLHSTLFAAAGLGQLLRTQGEPISYAAPGEDAVLLTALVGDKRAVRKDRTREGSLYEHERLITIGRDPDGPFGGVASVKKSAVISYGSELLAVIGIESESLSQYTLQTGYVGQADLSGHDTRGGR